MLLVIYNSGLFNDYNLYLSSVFNNTILRLVILLIIVGIANKNITIALLLILTLAISSYYKAENFEIMDNEENNNQEKNEKNEKNKKEKKTEKFNNSQFVRRETFISKRR